MIERGSQFHQLPMFASAHEIMQTHSPLDGDRLKTYREAEYGWEVDTSESDADLYRRKYRESTESWRSSGTPLRDSIVSDGVQTPIALQVPDRAGPSGKPEVLNGHHRLAVLAYHDRHSLVPVTHHEDHRDYLSSPEASKEYVIHE